MKQHATPVIFKGDKAINLKKVSLESLSHREGWIQDLCFKHPNLLPFAELELSFDDMVPICRELTTDSRGRVDLVYINKDGFITIAECKLWKNSEARREVVGQILDYAKDLSKWNYPRFETECLKAGNRSEKKLFEIFQEYPDIDEAEFVDNIQKNLKKGRFLLLIIGDGIRENMEELVKYIHRSGNLHFTLGLIELPVFKNPEEESEFIITPRILVQTKMIERVISIISDKPIEEDKLEQGKERSQTISEEVYFERLEKNIGTEKTEEFKQLITTIASQFNIKASLGRGKKGSFNLKLPNGYNFGTIYDSGDIEFIGNGRWADKEAFHRKYIDKIAHLVDGRFEWKYIKKTDGEWFCIPDLLEIKEKWIEALMEIMDEIFRLEEND